MLVGLKQSKQHQIDGGCRDKRRKVEKIGWSRQETKTSTMKEREQYVKQAPFVFYDLSSDRKKEKTKEKWRETEDEREEIDGDHQVMETEPNRQERVKSTTRTQI